MTATPDKPHIARELFLLLLLATLWGSSFTFIKVGVHTIPPVTLIAARTLIAGAILLALLRWRGIAMPRDHAMWRRFMVQAAINSVIPYALIAYAEQTTDAGMAAILNSTSPIFAFLITALVTRHEVVTARKLFGVAAGLAGTALVIGTGALKGIGVQFWSELALVGAAACYGVSAIFGKGFRGLDSMVPAAGSMICGAVVLVPASLLLDRPWTLSPSRDSILALLALSVFSTAIAFVIYFRLLRTLGSVGATAQAYLRVPIGVAVGVVFLGESLSPTAWIGLACVIAGVAAMTLPQRISGSAASA